tara:strand:+ start:215 stop:967 length:753 start_codon:yes stop_codon:yes gene_type:complete
MLKKLLVATAAMAISATTFAGISLSGLYEGTLDSHGAYTQDIHTTMKGTSGNSSVTVVLDKDFSVDDMYVETTTGPLTFKIGDSSGDDPDSTVLGVTMKAGAITLGLNQISGGNTTIDASGTLGGITVAMTDVTSTTRETTGTFAAGGLSTTVVYNKVAAGNNIDVTVSTTVAGLTLSANHDSNADGTSENEGSVSKALVGLGTVKGTMGKTGAGVTTKGFSLTRGIWTGEWEQVGSADGVTTLKATLAF